MRKYVRYAAALFLLVCRSVAHAGPANPDISVIGDTRVDWSEASDKATLGFEELEVAVVGPLNPYASAEIYVGVHGTDEFEIEEAKLLLDRYLPGGFGLTIGRYLQDFGQLNQVHTHAYPFVVRPLMHEEFFGGDGVVDDGVRLDWLAPIEPVTLRTTVGAVRGDLFLGGHGHEGEGEGDEEGVEPEIGVTARVDLFAETSESTSFLVGASVLHGQHDTVDNAKVTWFDFDGKARWDLGPSRAVVLNGEVVLGSLESSDELPKSNPSGWFVSADMRANRRWNVGGFVESSAERADDRVRTNRYGGFLGLALMEESTVFRLVGHVSDPEAGGAETGVLLQVLFGLGPHRPHRY